MPYKDKEKQKKYQQVHFQKNKNKWCEKTRARRQRNRDYVLSIKKQCKCLRCGIEDFRVLDFHHIDKEIKEDKISNMIHYASIETIQKEIDKCEVICSNCHRIEHYEDNRSLYDEKIDDLLEQSSTTSRV